MDGKSRFPSAPGCIVIRFSAVLCPFQLSGGVVIAGADKKGASDDLERGEHAVCFEYTGKSNVVTVWVMLMDI